MADLLGSCLRQLATHWCDNELDLGLYDVDVTSCIYWRFVCIKALEAPH